MRSPSLRQGSKPRGGALAARTLGVCFAMWWSGAVLAAVLLLASMAPARGASRPRTYSFGVVPQESALQLAATWGPMLAIVSHETGVRLRFVTAPDIPTFENRLAHGRYDFAYMNPYHYVVFSRHPGYRAIAHASNHRIRGIIVVARGSGIHSLRDLSGRTLAFPSPAAFAASILVRQELAKEGIAFTPRYVGSHESVYLDVYLGLLPAGGGIIRTLGSTSARVRSRLRVLWRSRAYTPHAIAVAPGVPSAVARRVQQALVSLRQGRQGRRLLRALNIQGWVAAHDADWNDVRGLHIELLDRYVRQ